MTRHHEVPDVALKVRAAGVVVLIASYSALRVPTLTSGIEAGLTFAAAVVAVFVFERSITELSDRKHHRRQRIDSIRNAVTEVFPVAARWPDADHDDPIEQAIAAARGSAVHAIVERGALTEYLFTHDVLCEPTPQRGIPLDQILARLKGEGVVPRETPGRHAAAQLQRERTGQFFGTL